MYIRFITQYENDYEEVRTGVFRAAYFLRKSDIIQHYDRMRLDSVLWWFENYLDAPDKFNHSKNRSAPNISLSWFKDTSTRHIARMYEMVGILEQYGLPVKKIRRRNPGLVVYEDYYQVSCIPNRPDKRLVR
jgi:hypothetical protein